MMKKGTLQTHQLQESWDIIQQIPVELRRIDIKSALNIAIKFNIYAYDAYFLECAGSLKCPIVTLDKAMQTIAREMGILVVE
jgi:predicted nucleic acid-binding protein